MLVSGHATVLDITENMLIEGRKRAETDQILDGLDWIVGDAMSAALCRQQL